MNVSLPPIADIPQKLAVFPELFYVRPVNLLHHIDKRRNAMNDREPRSTPIDSDRTEGSLKQAGGKLKEGAGNVLSDEKMKREGQADQGEGKLQNAWGSVKDKAREVTGSDDR